MRGVYLLLIHLTRKVNLTVGSLGKINFEKGFYIYVGSAQNNLEKRILRHLSKRKRIFWHIDYLLKNKYTKVIEVYYKEADKIEECKIAKILCKYEIPILNFGCCDCNCKSHFFKINSVI